jgi:acyl-CoA thioesterase-1
LRRIDWLLKQRIDVLVLELGGNDGLRGIAPENTQTNLQAIVERARQKYPEVRVVLAGMRMPPNFGADYVEKFQRIYPAVAKATGSALVPFLLEGVGGERSLNQADLIHPTAEGQRIVADNVWRVLKPLIEPGRTGATRQGPAPGG